MLSNRLQIINVYNVDRSVLLVEAGESMYIIPEKTAMFTAMIKANSLLILPRVLIHKINASVIEASASDLPRIVNRPTSGQSLLTPYSRKIGLSGSNSSRKMQRDKSAFTFVHALTGARFCFGKVKSLKAEESFPSRGEPSANSVVESPTEAPPPSQIADRHAARTCLHKVFIAFDKRVQFLF